jgi:small subunit ribosomal protein S17
MAPMKVEDIRAMSEDQRDGRRPQSEEGTFQPAFPARHRAAGEHLAAARSPPRYRPHQDHRRADAREEEVRGRIMPKRTLQGVVVSDKQAKTVVVRVDRRFTHPIYKKTIRRSKNYHAHDENSEFKPGDMVWIEESKPISKLKRWTVVRGEQKKTA